jgi:hypothetical protein
MGTEIYTASPLQAFLGSILTVLFLVLLGLVSIIMTIFNRKEKLLSRIFTIGLGAFLMLVGGVTAVITAQEYLTGSKTVIVKLNDKFIATDNCGDGDTCERYVLETASGPTKFYDLNVSEDAYEKAQVRVCYEVTYYPAKSLLEQLTGESTYGESYEPIATITRIAVADAAACP